MEPRTLGRVRLRLTLLFMLLTTIVYLVTSGCGVFRFWLRMNAAVDEEISTLGTELATRVTYNNGRPFLPMKQVVFHQNVSIQIFDPDGKLLQHAGADGVPVLVRNSQEISDRNNRYRTKIFPLISSNSSSPQDGNAAGILQVQVSTHQRDIAIHNYLETILLLAPVLLIGLAIAGSNFAHWAVRPIEQTMATLKRFLADSGHELGTPLAILRTTSDNLSLDVAGIPAAEERIQTLVRATDRMTKLVGDMTLLAKLETAELSLDKKNVHFDDLVKETISNFKQLFADKQLTIVCHIEPAMVKADKGALERLLLNLLQNATRYTEQGGTVTVELKTTENAAVLTVSDTGIGIPADALPHIFERFYRVDAARSAAKGGSGLGLAIVKATVDAHGGTITVTSEVGKGTRFTVSLPLLNRAH